jgi:hypothetical protein
MKYFFAVGIMFMLLAGCSDKKTVAPEVTTYDLSGRVVNQFGNAAVNVRVRASGQHNYSASVTTDTLGAYTVKAPEGAATISYSSTETVVFNLPRFISRDTSINVTTDTTANMKVRELTTIFHDPANSPLLWDMHGGVSHDSARYVFQDIDMVTDHMMMNHAYTIPDTFQHVGFILYGQAAPTQTSEIIVNAWVNGAIYNGHWRATFTTTPSYYHGALDTVTGLHGGALQLDLIFSPLDATYIYIRDIWVYCY